MHRDHRRVDIAHPQHRCRLKSKRYQELMCYCHRNDGDINLQYVEEHCREYRRRVGLGRTHQRRVNANEESGDAVAHHYRMAAGHTSTNIFGCCVCHRKLSSACNDDESEHDSIVKPGIQLSTSKQNTMTVTRRDNARIKRIISIFVIGLINLRAITYVESYLRYSEAKPHGGFRPTERVVDERQVAHEESVTRTTEAVNAATVGFGETYCFDI